MKIFYLDYNIVVRLTEQKEPELTKLIAGINRDSNRIVYSPAHVEEIAVSRMRNDYPEEKIFDKLEFLSKLTNNLELLPFERKDVNILEKAEGIYFCEEHPVECYKRVIADYARNDYAEAVSESVLTAAKEENIFNNDPDIVNNFDPEKILADPIYKLQISESFFLRMLSDRRKTKHELQAIIANDFRDIRKDFPAFECLMEIIFNYLEVLRYHPDKPQKHRSRLHDVTHAIYAAYCSVFVSEDTKLKNKAKAAYSFLGIPTQVVSLKSL